MKILLATPDGIRAAAAAIRASEVVVYPTETVYGLAVDPFDEMGVRKLFAIKGRDDRNPIPLIIDEPERVMSVASLFTDAAAAYAEAFWPGPLSLILPKNSALPDILTAGSEFVCVRCPSSEVARNLCREAGGVITSTSANLSGKPAALSIDEIEIAANTVIDGGRLSPSLPSTIIDPETGRILRHGAVLEAVIRTLVRR